LRKWSHVTLDDSRLRVLLSGPPDEVADVASAVEQASSLELTRTSVFPCAEPGAVAYALTFSIPPVGGLGQVGAEVDKSELQHGGFELEDAPPAPAATAKN
jgi:hypothetical protein